MSVWNLHVSTEVPVLTVMDPTHVSVREVGLGSTVLMVIMHISIDVSIVGLYRNVEWSDRC